MTETSADKRDSGEARSPAIPVEEVAKYPLPGMINPVQLAFSPDDRLLTYLLSPKGTLSRQLYAFDLESGEQKTLVRPPDGGATEQSLSLEEKLRRERQRQMGLGITTYAWAEKRDRLLVPLTGSVFVQDGANAPLREIYDGDGIPAIDPQFSPNGEWVSFVADGELFVVPAEGGEALQLTTGAREAGKTHGLAEFVAQEEMSRSHGYWWSQDSQHIAFTEVDETHIPVYRIVHQGSDLVGEGAQEDHRYPFAGGPNAKVRLGVISAQGGEPTWMDLGENEDIYLARVRWLPDGSLSAQLENREQTELRLVRFDIQTGQQTTLLVEKTDAWINLHNMFRPLKGDDEDGWAGFIWASERTGFFHLYLHDNDGVLIRPLTEGNWMVDAIAAVDEKGEWVYFTATRDSSTERHLYVVPFSGGEPRRITHEPGMHEVIIDHGYQRFVDIHDALDKPPNLRLRDLNDGSVLTTIYDSVDPRLEELTLTPPEIVVLQNRSGVELYGAIYRPEAKFGPGPYPTIVWAYGGPHAQLVMNGWFGTASMRAQYLRDLGFLVFVLDNQGSARRGLEFERVIKHRMGQIEVDDQVDGVRWLVEQGLADPDRVGIYGWSYGGYMAAMCLAKAPDIFKVAVAGAPVTNYDGYDTHYTERYMGTPQSNVEGFAEGSVMQHVHNMRGKLLLVHGLIDENVHFRHTARLINALIEARKPYDLLLFPDERHSPRKLADRVYMEERISEYFLKYL